MLLVSNPTSEPELNSVRALMRAFVAWHRERHAQDLALIEAYFDQATFDAELAALPGGYSPPRGSLLLATLEGEAAGCVAIRALDGQYCEMKRMFVYPRFHGLGVGLALGKRIISDARELGYRGIRLDTSIRQSEATSLYQRLGFKVTAPYYDLPKELREWLVFMELLL